MTYKQLLKSPKWQKLRLKVLKRDNYKCRHCSGTRNLEVHHLYYREGKLPWEYPLTAFLALCRKCHRAVHKKYKIPFLKKGQRYKGPLPKK